MIKKSILFISIFFSYNLFASDIQKAQVTVDKAIIYSTPYLNIPIGHLGRGTSVTIVELKTSNKKVVALTVSGKIAYMKSSDLFFAEKQNNEIEALNYSREDKIHQVSEIDTLGEEKIDMDKLIYRSGFSASYHRFTLGDNLKKYYSYTNTSSGNMFMASVEYYFSQDFFTYLGPTYISINDKNMGFTSLGLHLGGALNIFHSKALSLTTSAALIYSPYATQARIQGRTYSGSGYGAQGGAHLSILLTQHLNIRLGAGYFYYQTTALKHELDVGATNKFVYSTPPFKTRGVEYYLGASYLF